MMACQEAMEANPKKMEPNPVEHQEVPMNERGCSEFFRSNEEAVRGRHLAVE
jgi:hypothetical protein